MVRAAFVLLVTVVGITQTCEKSAFMAMAQEPLLTYHSDLSDETTCSYCKKPSLVLPCVTCAQKVWARIQNSSDIQDLVVEEVHNEDQRNRDLGRIMESREFSVKAHCKPRELRLEDILSVAVEYTVARYFFPDQKSFNKSGYAITVQERKAALAAMSFFFIPWQSCQRNIERTEITTDSKSPVALPQPDQKQ